MFRADLVFLTCAKTKQTDILTLRISQVTLWSVDLIVRFSLMKGRDSCPLVTTFPSHKKR